MGDAGRRKVLGKQIWSPEAGRGLGGGEVDRKLGDWEVRMRTSSGGVALGDQEEKEGSALQEDLEKGFGVIRKP